MDDQITGETQRPVARRDDLVVEHLGDETLVYDLRSHKAHCLNAGAALVWQHCNGEYDKAALTTLLQKNLGTPNDPSVVDVALQELTSAKLLEQGSNPAKISRRDVAMRLKLVVGASVVLPAVMSIVAPSAASAASFVINCEAATTSLACLPLECSKSNKKLRCKWAGNKCGCAAP